MNRPEQELLTKEDIETLIRSRTEETSTLEYKRAAALELNDKKRDDISKDVSAMANSAGGRILYGVKEDQQKKYFPEAIDPVQRSSITTETLQQIIESRIQPKIPNVHIYGIPITEDTAIYVVDVPQSTTAHQASDKRYYKRVNKISQAMEDYEIRDVMNRKSAITLSLRLIPDQTRDEERAGNTVTLRPGMHFLVSVENSGDRIAKYCLVELSADPFVIHKSTGESHLTNTEAGLRKVFKFSNFEGQYHPILPNYKRRLGWITVTHSPVKEDAAKPAITFFPTSATDYTISWKIFSDGGQPNYGEVDLQDLVAQHNAMMERFSKDY